MKHWHNEYPEFEKTNKRFTFIGLSAGTIGTMALLGGGTAAALGAFGGKKKDTSAQFQQYNPADYNQLRDLLYGIQSKGYPEIMNENYWGPAWQKTSRDINELYQGKRQLGVGSTPEVAQLGNARSDLMSNLIGQNLNVRQNALNMLAGITPRPTTQYTPESASTFENLLNFGAPIASAGLSGYMQNQSPMNKAMSQYLTNQIKPINNVSDVFSNRTQGNAYTDLLASLLGG